MGAAAATQPLTSRLVPWAAFHSFTRRASDLIIPAVAAKIGDRKVSVPGTALLYELSSACTPAYVLQSVWKTVSSSRSVMVHKGGLQLIAGLAEEFGAVSLDLAAVVDILKVRVWSSGGMVLCVLLCLCLCPCQDVCVGRSTHDDCLGWVSPRLPACLPACLLW